MPVHYDHERIFDQNMQPIAEPVFLDEDGRRHRVDKDGRRVRLKDEVEAAFWGNNIETFVKRQLDPEDIIVLRHNLKKLKPFGVLPLT